MIRGSLDFDSSINKNVHCKSISTGINKLESLLKDRIWKSGQFDWLLKHLPVDWLVDTVVSVCTEQQGPPTCHGASSWHPAKSSKKRNRQLIYLYIVMQKHNTKYISARRSTSCKRKKNIWKSNCYSASFFFLLNIWRKKGRHRLTKKI